MRLSDLLPLSSAAAVGDVEVRGIAVDSRRVRPGDVFFALAGTREDGRRHAREAVARGAVAVVAEDTLDVADTIVVRAGGARALLGKAAARLAGDPTAALTVVGVTGTNGKTTTTEWIGAMFRAAGRDVAVAGNVGRALSAVRATAEAWIACSMAQPMRACASLQLAPRAFYRYPLLAVSSRECQLTFRAPS